MFDVAWGQSLCITHVKTGSSGTSAGNWKEELHSLGRVCGLCAGWGVKLLVYVCLECRLAELPWWWIDLSLVWGRTDAASRISTCQNTAELRCMVFTAQKIFLILVMCSSPPTLLNESLHWSVDQPTCRVADSVKWTKVFPLVHPPSFTDVFFSFSWESYRGFSRPSHHFFISDLLLWLAFCTLSSWFSALMWFRLRLSLTFRLWIET